MELKELTSKVIELLNIESPEQIPESLMEIVLNGKIKYFDGFCDLVKDLSIDWLQKIFQFYLADRIIPLLHWQDLLENWYRQKTNILYMIYAPEVVH